MTNGASSPESVTRTDSPVNRANNHKPVTKARPINRHGRAANPYNKELTQLIELVQGYMYLPDPGALVLTLASVEALQMSGPPVWLMLVGPPSSGKSDILYLVSSLPFVHMAATMTEAALLSGVEVKKRAANATGGLLMQVGVKGMLISKDFTSILSMNRDQRASVMAALREIYDGGWTRHLGTGGGQSLSWSGKMGFLGGVTEAIDSHHSVTSSLGDRFMYCRMPVVNNGRIADAVLSRDMDSAERVVLRDLTSDFLLGLGHGAAKEWTADEKEWLKCAANVAALARSAVERDSYNKEIVRVFTPESCGRLTGALGQLHLALDRVGCSSHETRRLIVKTAVDCIPGERARLITLLGLGENAEGLLVDEMCGDLEVDHPPKSVTRALEEMECLRIVRRTKVQTGAKGRPPEKWQITVDFAHSWYELAHYM